MPKLILKVGEERMVPTGGLFLSIIDADGSFKLSNPKTGVISGSVGRQYQLKDISEMLFFNDSQSVITIEYEVANIVITSVGKGAVTIANEVVVSRIVEAIQVESSATVENGKMAKNVSTAFLPVPDNRITIPSGQTLEVFAARAALNRMVALQIITNNVDMGKIRIGNSIANTTPTKGFFVQGNEDAPAGYEWETETAVFVCNYSGHDITLAGGETWRA